MTKSRCTFASTCLCQQSVSWIFFRATLCISALLSAGLCPFVSLICPSVTLVYCIQTAKDIIKKNFLGLIAPLFSFPESIRCHSLRRGEGSAIGVIKGKFAIVGQYFVTSRKDRFVVAMGTRSIRVSSDDLEWPWKAGREGGAVFPVDVYIYARTVWPTAIKFGMITHVGKERVCNVSGTPLPRGVAPAHPNLCWATIHGRR